MDFLSYLKMAHFSFIYGDEKLNGYNEGFTRITEQTEANNCDCKSYKIIYNYRNVLEITEHIDFYSCSNAVKWVLQYKNISDENTRQIRRVFDCDIDLPFNQNYIPSKVGHKPEPSNGAKLFRTNGSNWQRNEYSANQEYIHPGQTITIASSEGRSAQGDAPYIEINDADNGILYAVGWSGQWKACCIGGDKTVILRSGIEFIDTYLEPGEFIRTSSVLMLAYDKGQLKGHVAFRRLFKKHFSLIGKEGRPSMGPLAITSWGSLPSAKMIERIKAIAAKNLGFEYYWIDAGWYGHSQSDCLNEHVGDWGSHTGSWNINPKYHPNGLLDVVKTANENGLKMLLWIEPERVLRDTDTPKGHPDWFLKQNETDMQYLLDLGNAEALQGTFEMIAEKIETLNLKCYRQDFNTNPLPYWRYNDKKDRIGMKEIYHITGLYKLWDMLLERFPDIFIDNCASGGRRNDIELLSRSMPLWRSDYQCWFDADAETAQIHNTGISSWIPYSGTGIGLYFGDRYKLRSAYASSMSVPYWMYAAQDFKDAEELEDIKAIFSEYLSVREYMSCDYYPLVENSLCDTTWCAWQYNRPEEGDGIIVAFRRPKSPMISAEFILHGLEKDAEYEFTDSDTGEKIKCCGGSGFKVMIKNKRESKLFRYRKV